MSKHHHEHHDSYQENIHTNGFVDMNGIPYLLAEYIDKEGFMQIDRSAIRSDIFVDTSDAMRAVIDISIDDIGRRCEGKYLNVTGNTTKQKKFLDMVSKHKETFAHQLPVLRRGIVARVNYQLERYQTQQVIRTTSEDFRITDRNYFIDINPRDIEDNGIVCNFEHSAVSTINEFTHGRDKMVLRVTGVELFYEFVKNGHKGPHIKQTNAFPNYPTGMFYEQMDPYKYHKQFQHQQFLGSPDDYVHQRPEPVTPPSWNSFNRFYHFDNDNKNIILHDQEIYDPNMPSALLPCGRCTVNRSFIINPAHRLIFKFSIWKNDVTLFSNTQRVAKALEVPVLYHNYHESFDDRKDLKKMIREIINENREENMKQNQIIQQLMYEIQSLKEEKYYHGHHDEHHCDHSETNDRLEDIEDLLQKILSGEKVDDEPDDEIGCGCNHEHTSITATDIRDIINEIKMENQN